MKWYLLRNDRTGGEFKTAIRLKARLFQLFGWRLTDIYNG